MKPGNVEPRHMHWDICEQLGTTCCSLSDAHSSLGVRIMAARDLSLMCVILATRVTSLGLSFPLCSVGAVIPAVFPALLL